MMINGVGNREMSHNPLNNLIIHIKDTHGIWMILKDYFCPV